MTSLATGGAGKRQTLISKMRQGRVKCEVCAYPSCNLGAIKSPQRWQRRRLVFLNPLEAGL